MLLIPSKMIKTQLHCTQYLFVLGILLRVDIWIAPSVIFHIQLIMLGAHKMALGAHP